MNNSDATPPAVADHDRLIRKNLGLAHWLAHKYGGNLDPHEALSAAMGGLLTACEHHDATRGKWSTLATYYSRSMLSQARTREARHTTVSLDAPVDSGDAGSETLLDTLPTGDPGPETRAEYREVARKALSAMRPREREIVSDYFGLRGIAPRTLQELAEARGCTRAGMGFRINRALDRARLALLDR